MTADVIDRVADRIKETVAEEECALDRMDHASEPDEDDVAGDARDGLADAIPLAETRERFVDAAPRARADDEGDRQETDEEESALDRMDRESEPGNDDAANDDAADPQ